jgi:serine-type D-Ala-D-Ala carboxypeptidase/endopeptidase
MKSKPMTRVMCTVVLLVTWQTTAESGDIVEPARFRALAQPLIDGGWASGLAVGLVSDRGTQVVGFGRVSEVNSHPPSGDTIFEIGSVSKVFTSLLLAQMTFDDSGDLTLTDPVQKVLGESLSLPKGAEREITLLHLATHTSGLPRSPDNLDPKDPNNPFVDYSVDQLRRFLAHHKLVCEPGTRFEYSNLGVGLLGYVLAVKSGKSYESLIRDRICKPLGMADTGITLDKTHQARRTQGHDADGNPVRDWDWDVLAGAGAIHSTVADMLKFLAANLTPKKTSFGSAIAASHLISFKSLDDEDGVGLGWRIRQRVALDDDSALGVARRMHSDGRVIWHGGDTGGYSTFVGFWPEKRVGVVVLANTKCLKVQLFGFCLLELLRAGTVEPLDLPAVVRVKTAALDRLVGTYRILPSTSVHVTRSDDQLFLQIAGQEACKCYPTSERSFFLRVVDAKVTFEINESGKVSDLVIHQNGEEHSAIRTN